jgi:adenylate cyclase
VAVKNISLLRRAGSRLTRFSFTVTILTAFSSVFVAGLAASMLGYMEAGNAAALGAARIRLAQAAEIAAARAATLIGSVVALTTTLAETAPWGHRPDRPAAPLLAALTSQPELMGAAVVTPDGGLRQVVRIAALPAGRLPPWPEGTAWALREDPPGSAVSHWRFAAASGAVLAEAATPRAVSDTTDEQWVLQARQPGPQISTLYDLPFTGRPGLSVSEALADRSGVLGFHLGLDALSAFLARQAVSPHGTVFLFDENGIVLASADRDRSLAAGGGRRTAWITLQGSADPLFEAVWRAYATNLLPPGRSGVLDVDGEPTLVRLEAVPGRLRPQILAAVAAPQIDFTGPVIAAVQRGSIAAIAAFMVGLGGIALLSWRIARPIGQLTREADAIRAFELSRPLTIASRIREVDQLSRAMAAMKATLATFGAYVPRDLVRQFLAAGATPRLGGERLPLTIMFTDVRGFTTIAEPIDPEELMRIVSAYFEALTAELLACGATIDKYIGDAVMAFWNAPRRDPGHAASACRAGLRANALTERLADAFVARGWPALPTRFGIHTGEAVVGNVGSSDRMSYTAMGSMVNLANRLEGLNRLYGTHILVSDATRRDAGADFVFRPVDLVIPKGAMEPMAIHELVGYASRTGADAPASPDSATPDAATLARLPAWEAFIDTYRAGRLRDAREALAALGGEGADPLAALYTGRLAALGDTPPPGWTPAIRLTEK